MFKGLIATGLVATLALGGVFAANRKADTTEAVGISVGFTLPANTKDPVKLEKISAKRISPEADQILVLNTAVDRSSVDFLLAGLERIRQDYDTAYIMIDSPGGSVIDGGRLIDYMKTTRLKVVTVCTAICASMAAQIHQQGHVRLMQPKATLMFHQASGGVQGTVEQMESQVRWIKGYVDRLDAEIVARTKITYAEFKTRLASELWLEGVDCLALGFADGLAYVNIPTNDKGNMAPMAPLLTPEEKKTQFGPRKHEFTY